MYRKKKNLAITRKGEKVTVIELLSEDENIGSDFFVLIEYSGRKMGVPPAQLKPLKVDKETKQTIENWQYWKARDYSITCEKLSRPRRFYMSLRGGLCCEEIASTENHRLATTFTFGLRLDAAL